MNNWRSSNTCFPSLQAVRKARARTGLLSFTRWTKPDYQIGKAHQLLAQHLDLLVEGKIKRLMVFMPPRHGKSELVSRRLPPYFLGRFPNSHVIACSYSADLASRMNRDCQRILESPAYRELFPDVCLSEAGGRQQKAARTDEFFEIVGKRGSYRSCGVGGGITGMGFDLGIVDDPVKNSEESLSALTRDRIDEWYSSTFWTRQSPSARILVTMTRWHRDDIAGRLLDRMSNDPDADAWTVLRLPGIADVNLHPLDHRNPGEALWPERFSVHFMARARAALGPTLFAGMYQQSPTTPGGNHFKEQWLQKRFHDDGDHWRLGLMAVPKSECTVFMTCDPAASDKVTADHTAIGVWALTLHNDLLLLDMIRGRFGIEEIVPRLLAACRRWEPDWIGIEANGFQVSIVNEARHTAGIPPVRELSHEGKGKLVRATPAIILAESGKLWLPAQADWVKSYIDELVGFTGVVDKCDDQVDVTSYAVWQIPRAGREVSIPVEAGDRDNSNAGRIGLWGRRC